ncbi:hypothetical protein INT45_013272 [Circinella minor]|uniref:Secreted protein n=1 Tax=Circinella minor TaxID=1195481 RepID=A0A8H7S3C6_9FUNG|nr:hypothetical protein INT45_013272 [Circinella minor]
MFCRNRDVLLSLSVLMVVCKEGMRGSSIPSRDDNDGVDGRCCGEVGWEWSLGVGRRGCKGMADDEGVDEKTENLKKKRPLSASE